MSSTSKKVDPRIKPAEVFLGYCCKQMPSLPTWLSDPRVKRIASVSTCIAARPDGWIERWDFNDAGLYDSVFAARAAAAGAGPEFDLFAYSFAPVRFDRYGAAVHIAPDSVFGKRLPPSGEEPSANGLQFLGYDPVQRWAEIEPGRVDHNPLAGGFGCSPLSCNHCAPDYPVNEWCLLSSWADAARAASDFASVKKVEPGCYYVFGVWHKPASPIIE